MIHPKQRRHPRHCQPRTQDQSERMPRVPGQRPEGRLYTALAQVAAKARKRRYRTSRPDRQIASTSRARQAGRTHVGHTNKREEQMTTIQSSARDLSDAEQKAQLRRAVVAGTVGTIIEAYDFLLYVQVAPLVFAALFFPRSDPLVGTLEAFGIYAVGFVSRPVGAALFGHYGDRIGRKVTLIATLLLTGLSTFAVGFVPGYATVGVWGAVILTVLRFIQGIGLGGEWGGATLIAMEWAKTNAHRGFITAWPQWGGPAG